MLFNSAGFLFLFLPVTLLIFLGLKRFGHGHSALAFIGVSSLVFYAMWDFRYLSLLLGSIIFNFFIGRQVTNTGPHKIWLCIGIGGNLACLGWFKYAGFFVENLDAVLPYNIPVPEIILPLGISFFTFVQIAYLVDAWRGEASRHSFIEYLTFVTFFPHLIAGPILNHKNIMPQFRALPDKGYDWHKAAMGLSLLALGLFKKVVIADELAKYSSPVFLAAENGEIISFLMGWQGALAYTLQLYFDFSAYSDMAIGIGLMFGIRLPDNFFSPYKSTGIIEFWQRWHITLSQFLRNYLYIPLGGNRKGTARRYANLIVTMLLGGLWHGAGWTFIVWGGLHGLYLCINHLYRSVFPPKKSTRYFRLFSGWFLTMMAVIIAWVFFRSESLVSAFSILRAMGGFNDFGTVTNAWKIIAPAALIACLAPNTMQIISYAENKNLKKWYSWQSNRQWMAITTVTLSATLFIMIYYSNRVSEFIYFQF